jgi:hypothetical protein
MASLRCTRRSPTSFALTGNRSRLPVVWHCTRYMACETERLRTAVHADTETSPLTGCSSHGNIHSLLRVQSDKTEKTNMHTRQKSQPENQEHSGNGHGNPNNTQGAARAGRQRSLLMRGASSASEADELHPIQRGISRAGAAANAKHGKRDVGPAHTGNIPKHVQDAVPPLTDTAPSSPSPSSLVSRLTRFRRESRRADPAGAYNTRDSHFGASGVEGLNFTAGVDRPS